MPVNQSARISPGLSGVHHATAACRAAGYRPKCAEAARYSKSLGEGNMIRACVCWLTILLIIGSSAIAQTREQKVRGDKAKIEADGFWIYNDLARGYAEAKKTGQPLVVALRCIPCEQCVKLDDDLVDKDERLRPLLEQFVRVRLISANGLDLSLFQYDT